MTDSHRVIAQTIKKAEVVSDVFSYLEIGVREGDSLKVALSSPCVTLAVGVDNWGGDAGGTNRGNCEHVWNSLTPSQKDRVLLLSGDSKVIVPSIKHLFDVIYIDGDHSEEGCIEDLNNVLPLLKDNGIILVDDLCHPQHLYLYEAVRKWAKTIGFNFFFHPGEVGVGELYL